MTIEELEAKINEVYVLKDPGVVRVILATVIANKLGLSDKPVWLLLLAGSSGGKTALLQLVDKCGPWIVSIDTLTTNTFASGLKGPQEASLLWKANNGVLVFKDFTTVTSMNEEGLREIMGQLRAIYDGTFDKKTGNNADTAWVGKIGIIAGGTIAAQRKLRQFSEQGERFINYIMKVADAKEITMRAINNQRNLKGKEQELSAITAQFVNEILEKQKGKTLDLDEQTKIDMVELADFATLARSPVIMDKIKTDRVLFVPDREMPARMGMMLTNVIKALGLISSSETIGKLEKDIIHKIALDSIPVERRVILRLLTEYKEASTKNIAIYLNYHTDTVRAWCYQLNALKLIDRIAHGDGASDTWVLKQEYRILLSQFDDVRMKNEILSDFIVGDEEPYVFNEKEEEALRELESKPKTPEDEEYERLFKDF